MSSIRLSRIGTFLAIYAVVISVPSLVVALGSTLLQDLFPGYWWVLPAGLFAALALAAPMVYLGLFQRIEGNILRDQRRYHRTLIAASAGMTRVKEINRLCTLIVHVVNRAVRLTNSSLFLYDTKEQRYFLHAVRYPSLIAPKLSVPQEHPLVPVLRERKDLILIDELQNDIKQRGGDRAKPLTVVYEWMRQLEARLIVPSFSASQLLGFLVLSAKRSGEKYTTDDIAVFSGLANQAALAIENAMFFEELRTNEAYMIQSEKLASLGQLASGMAHEIHNPQTIISGESQLYLERFRNKDPKVDELLLSVIEECKRAADITRRILRFAKPAPPDVAPVDLKAVAEESLTLAGYQVRMEKIERIVELPDGLPKVRSNQNQLQEVLLNLILNACQAMGEKGGKLILSAKPNGSHVTLKVTDTGPGIPNTALRKVFDPFYTTKPTGTGLGLFVSQRIIRSHGGTIDLESVEGKGACFTIELPIWQEKPRENLSS